MCCLPDGWHGRRRLSATLCRWDIFLLLVNKKIDMSMSVFSEVKNCLWSLCLSIHIVIPMQQSHCQIFI